MLGVMLENLTTSLITLLTIVAIVILRSSRKISKKYAHLPGPPPLLFLGNALSFTKNNLDVIKTLVEIANTYDGFALVWLGSKPLVIITDPDHLQIYYTSTKNIDRPDLYNDIADILGRDSIFSANGDIWKLKRKMFMSTFHTMPMETIIKNITKVLPKVVSNFQKMSDGGKVFPALFSLQKAAAYSIMELKENGEMIPNVYAYNMFKKYPNEPLEMLINEGLNTAITAVDTSAGTLGFILLVLALFPEVQERVYQEDQQIQKMLNGKIPDFENLQKYEYLERVIKETLRLFPVGPLLGRKMVEDTYFGKHLIPKGTDVGVLAYYTYRNPQFFPDPLIFDPDRFLPERVAKNHPYAYNPFSAGPRSCPGNRYAMTFLKITVPGIIRNFKIKSHYKNITEAFENSIAKVTLTDKQGYPIIMEPRN